MAAERPIEIKALSGRRAFPPLILVLYHFGEGHHYQNAFWYDALVAKGYLWVEFFFALSGFILVHVYGRREPSPPPCGRSKRKALRWGFAHATNPHPKHFAAAQCFDLSTRGRF